MTTLAAMVADLQSEVPAVDGVPTTAQYNQAVEEAVLDFSRRCGLAKISTLAIISGTATYALPTDFLKMISVDALVGVDDVIVASKLIPISKDFEETFTIVNKQITFYPTPQYTMTRYFKYKAGWIATTGDYTTLGDDEAQIVLLKAKSNAKGKLMNSLAAGGMKYSLGAVSVDKTGDVDSLSKDIFSLHSDYVTACDHYNGHVMFAGLE